MLPRSSPVVDFVCEDLASGHSRAEDRIVLASGTSKPEFSAVAWDVQGSMILVNLLALRSLHTNGYEDEDDREDLEGGIRMKCLITEIKRSHFCRGSILF